MGLLDFLKRNELNQIEALNLELQQQKTDLSRFQALIDHEVEVEKLKQQIQSLQEASTQTLTIAEQKLQTLNQTYKESLEIYSRLRKEISSYESKLELVEYGIYEPVYDFEKSDDYRQEQNKVIEQQKNSIKADTAAVCPTAWTVEGSEAKGRAVVNVYKKLMLRAFNGEASALIAKVKWNNINQMRERINNTYDAINKLGEGFRVHITSQYLNLKVKELILEHEYQLKRQQEKEELRAIQEELREEEKARREFEQAQREAEKEEANYQRALDKARKEIEVSTGDKYNMLESQIARLEQELLEAQAKKERALSMAQQTKRGHVYIISNIGSFGENVYKIGMTRRLEPLDRVRELGDASVPFQFDVHAMIYSNEARSLENGLHIAFSNKKVNMLNYRKEFFNVTLEEIEQKVKELGFEAEFITMPEAMQYRETLAILEKQKSESSPLTLEQIIGEEFPSSLS